MNAGSLTTRKIRYNIYEYMHLGAGGWAVLDLNQWLLPCEDSTLPLS